MTGTRLSLITTSSPLVTVFDWEVVMVGESRSWNWGSLFRSVVARAKEGAPQHSRCKREEIPESPLVGGVSPSRARPRNGNVTSTMVGPQARNLSDRQFLGNLVHGGPCVQEISRNWDFIRNPPVRWFPMVPSPSSSGHQGRALSLSSRWFPPT